jgi:chromosome segregation ATPase
MKPVLTGEVPFNDQAEMAVMYTVAFKGNRPNKPKEIEVPVNISDEIWTLITDCWAEDPTLRPTMRRVLDKFTQICESPSSKGSLKAAKEHLFRISMLKAAQKAKEMGAAHHELEAKMSELEETITELNEKLKSTETRARMEMAAKEEAAVQKAKEVEVAHQEMKAKADELQNTNIELNEKLETIASAWMEIEAKEEDAMQKVEAMMAAQQAMKAKVDELEGMNMKLNEKLKSIETRARMEMAAKEEAAEQKAKEMTVAQQEAKAKAVELENMNIELNEKLETIASAWMEIETKKEAAMQKVVVVVAAQQAMKEKADELEGTNMELNEKLKSIETRARREIAAKEEAAVQKAKEMKAAQQSMKAKVDELEEANRELNEKLKAFNTDAVQRKKRRSTLPKERKVRGGGLRRMDRDLKDAEFEGMLSWSLEGDKLGDNLKRFDGKPNAMKSQLKAGIASPPLSEHGEDSTEPGLCPRGCSYVDFPEKREWRCVADTGKSGVHFITYDQL